MMKREREKKRKKTPVNAQQTMIHSHEALHQTIRGASKKPLRKGRRSIRRRLKKPSQHPTQNIPKSNVKPPYPPRTHTSSTSKTQP
jgi:hypothetical protein